MKKVVLIAALAALSACHQNKAEPGGAATEAAATPAPTATATATAMAAKDYVGTWDSTMKDGTKGKTIINADMTYVDKDPKAGDTKGKFAVKDGKACFAPDNGKPEQCWTVGAAGTDGWMPAKADDGTEIKVKKQA